MVDAVHHSSQNTNWQTPKWFFNHLDNIFKFELDPCSSKDNALCPEFFTKEDDGLSKSWAGKRVFMNPPYGKGVVDKWVAKAHDEAMNHGALVVAILPARTDPQWFWIYCRKAMVYFIERRIKFDAPPDLKKTKDDAPFPSILVIFSKSQPLGAWQLTDDSQVSNLNYCNIKIPTARRGKTC